MALVDDNEVKEVLRPLLIIRLSTVVVAHHRLEDGEIDIPGFRQLSVQSPVAGFLIQAFCRYALHRILMELLEVVLGLISQYVPVSDKQDARFQVCSLSIPIGLK